jgi:hypothetical protein
MAVCSALLPVLPSTNESLSSDDSLQANTSTSLPVTAQFYPTNPSTPS